MFPRLRHLETGLALSGTTLAPRCQIGRIDAFAPQQCTDLPRLATLVSLGQDASFLAGCELPTSGDRDHLGLRWRRAGSRVCARLTGFLQRGFQPSGLRYGLHYRFHRIGHELHPVFVL